MALSLGTNFDHALLRSVQAKDVSVVYGKLHNDVIGGGRPAFLLPEVTAQDLEEHVRIAHSQNIEFNYLWNTCCLDNLEMERETNKKIVDHLDWLRAIKVDWITVVFPYFVELIKRRAPEIRVSLSMFADVNCVQKAKLFEKMGVDEITLPDSYNRNFGLLRKLRKSVSCGFQLIATNTCLMTCPHRHVHNNYLSHASQAKGYYTVNHSLLSCTRDGVKDPAELIKSPWIRPEDLHFYEEIGFSKFKLTSRMMRTERLVRVVDAYHRRRWDGDLGLLLNLKVKEDFVPPNLKMLKSMTETMSDEAKVPQWFNELVFAQEGCIDNRSLDGFLEAFVRDERDCQNRSCGEDCRYCYDVAKRAVSYDKEFHEALGRALDERFGALASGTFFENGTTVAWSEDAREKMTALLRRYTGKRPESYRIGVTILAEDGAIGRGTRRVEIPDVESAGEHLRGRLTG